MRSRCTAQVALLGLLSLGSPLPASANEPALERRSLRLDHAQAGEVSELLRSLLDATSTLEAQITADPATNTLQVEASEATLRMIEGLVAELDTRRDPIRVDAVVLELREPGERAPDHPIRGILRATGPLRGTILPDHLRAVDSTTGRRVRQPLGQAAIQAAARTRDLHVRTSMSVSTLDGEAVSIVVGTTRSLLRLTPTLREDGLLELALAGDTDGAEPGSGPFGDSRWLLRRGQSVIVAGAPRVDALRGLGIPVLGALPRVGHLFRWTTAHTTRLLLVLTPEFPRAAAPPTSSQASRAPPPLTASLAHLR